MRLFTALFVSALLATSPVASAPHSAGHEAVRLFDDGSLLALQLDAPLDKLFSTAKATGKDADVSVDGALRYTDPSSGREVTIDRVRVSVRGNTSRRDSECTFPKLKLEFAAQPAGSLFAGITSLKIGTHCGERLDGELTRLGRWANEKAPPREAMVYRMVAATGVATLQARAARIAYVNGDTRVERSAMLLEDEDAARARLGASGDLKAFDNARARFAIDEAAAITFAQAMIGNFDWAVKFSPGDFYRNDDINRLWNVLALRRPDGSAFPLIYDFDLAGPVVGGRHPWFPKVYNDAFFDPRSHVAVEVLGQVQRTRTLFARTVLDRMRQRFLRAKPAVYRAVDAAPVDDHGRVMAREYLDHFFDDIATDEAYYRPVTIRKVPLFLDSGGTSPACGAGDLVPPGTVVSAPLATEGERVQVNLVDTTWHWASRCDAVHRGPVWIAKDAIGTNFPDDQSSVSRSRKP